MNDYHSLRQYCVNDIYVRILEMNETDRNKEIERLKKNKSQQLSSVKEFVRKKYTRKQHFDMIKSWHWQKQGSRKQLVKLLNGLSLLLPGEKERRIYNDCIKRKPYLIEDAVLTHNSFKFWFVRIVNELYRGRPNVKTSNISIFNSMEEVHNNQRLQQPILELYRLKAVIHKLKNSSSNSKLKEKHIKLYSEKIEAILSKYPDLKTTTIETQSTNNMTSKQNNSNGGSIVKKEMFVFNFRDINKIFNDLNLGKMGKDYGNTEHHQLYTHIVRKHIKENGRVTYPKYTEERKEEIKKRNNLKISSAIFLQYVCKKIMKKNAKKRDELKTQ